MKYYIVGKTSKEGPTHDTSGNLNSYYELGWEVMVTHYRIKKYLYEKKISDQDVIVTTNDDRKFLYETTFKNVISWDFNTNKNSISFYVDENITLGFNNKQDGKKKFLWGLESKNFNSNFFDIVKKNLDNVLETYELIFTYNEDLLKLDSKFRWVPAQGTWIESPNLNEKNKLVSMITSDKKFTENQKFRFDFANKNKNKLDLYGTNINPIKNKEEGLCDYMFSVCIENETLDTYFTEKILDCFATGTIPIYVGTKKVVEHFDSNGIIFLNDDTLDKLNYELFLSKRESMEENLERVKSFNTVEDFIYDKYLKQIL